MSGAAGLASFVLYASHFALGHQYPFQEKVDLNVGTLRGHAVLRVEPIILRGLGFEVTLEFHNDGATGEFYNPFFNDSAPFPGELAVYDSDRKYLGNLLYAEHTPPDTVDQHYWTVVPSGGFTGVKLRLMGANLRERPGAKVQLLPPGKYYIQIVFYKGFVPSSLNRRNLNPLPSPGKLDNAELFRSNLIKAVIADS